MVGSTACRKRMAFNVIKASVASSYYGTNYTGLVARVLDADATAAT